MAAVAQLRANAAEIRGSMEKMIEKRLAQIGEPADGPRGERGLPGERGPMGRLKTAKAFVEGGVHYEGDVVLHCGATYQARCDTAREPPHHDWICVARAGEHGKTRTGPKATKKRPTVRRDFLGAAKWRAWPSTNLAIAALPTPPAASAIRKRSSRNARGAFS